MVAGVERYYQIAPCFRDEDPRADRAAGAFYQLDMEMAFADREDVFRIIENFMYSLFSKFCISSISKPKFIRIPYKTAVERYGSDKYSHQPIFIGPRWAINMAIEPVQQ